MSAVQRFNGLFRLDISEETQHKLKLFGITALIFGTGYFIHKCYQQRSHKHPLIALVHDDANIDEDRDTLMIHEASPKPVPKCPAIHVHDAVYGLAKIELIDLSGQETEFQIEINDHRNIRFLQFTIDNIELDLDLNKTYIYCRLPLALKDYFIEFRMRCKVSDKLGALWTSFSSKTVLKVPSSLISRNFKVNETVTFVPKGSNQGSSGTIIKIVDADCTLYVIQETLGLTYHMVHCSRIYRKGPYLYNVMDAASDATQRRMDKTVLLGMEEDDEESSQSMDVFNCLCDVYTNYAKQMEIDGDVHHVYIGRFIAKNVMDALYDCTHERGKCHLVHCIMEYKHRFMKLVPVWSNSVRNAVALERIGVKTNICEQQGRYWCDLCGVEVSRYDWIYRCDTRLLDRHFFCLRCVWDIMAQHMELTQFLKLYLRPYLYDVCIAEIASFVCGAVVSV